MANLIDQWNLAQDVNFTGRVRQSFCVAAIAIHGESQTVLTAQRDAFGKQVLLNQIAGLPALLAIAVAADSTVATLAGSPPLQANVTDAAISNAVSACWNSFAVRD